VVVATVATIVLADHPAGRGRVAAAWQATPIPIASPAAVGSSDVQIAARGLAAAPESGVLYAVGSLSRSLDGGATWELAGPPPPPGRLVVAAGDPLLLLAGARPPCARGDPNPPLLHRSTDGGATWAPVAGTPGVEPLTLWADTQLALGASCAGLLVSTDAGQTWPEQPAPLMEPGFDVSGFAVIAGTDPAARAALVLGTSEGGTSQLRRLDLADPGQPAASDALTTFWGGGSLAGLASGQGERFVVGTANGVLISVDGGATWTLSRTGLEEVTLSVDPTQGPIPDAELQRGFGIPAVAIDPTRDGRLFAGTVDGLYVSLDGGAWERVPGIDGIVSRIVVSPDAGQLLVETDRAVQTLPLAP
jgi:photosystem II stability/assembly factor-like uncharacterized protein